MEEFIKYFADQFDVTEMEEFTPQCAFRELDEWSSLTGLAILNVIGKKYGVQLTPSEMQKCITIEDVYNLLQSKL